jgi:hypothetical protein
MRHILIFFCLLFIFLFSCKGTIKKEWSETELLQLNICTNTISTSLMLHSQNPDFTTEKINAITNCFKEKVLINFPSYIEFTNDSINAIKLFENCVHFEMSNGSVLGKWSDLDISKFRNDTEDVFNRFGEKKESLQYCLQKKFENKYSSYYEVKILNEGIEPDLENFLIQCINEN